MTYAYKVSEIYYLNYYILVSTVSHQQITKLIIKIQKKKNKEINILKI